MDLELDTAERLAPVGGAQLGRERDALANAPADASAEAQRAKEPPVAVLHVKELKKGRLAGVQPSTGANCHPPTPPGSSSVGPPLLRERVAES